MTTVQETITDGVGPIAVERVEFRLWGEDGPLHGWVTADDSLVAAAHVLRPDPTTGAYSVDLPANAAVDPAGTVWRRTIVTASGTIWDDIIVPASGTHQVRDLLTVAPGTIAPTWAVSLTDRVTAVEGRASVLEATYPELDYAEIKQSATFTATAFLAIDFIPGLVVTVPDLAAPVTLELIGQVATVTTVGNLTVAIFPMAAVNAWEATKGVPLYGVPTEATASNGIPFRLSVRLPPHSAGDYKVGARIESGPTSAKFVASDLGPVSLEVFRR